MAFFLAETNLIYNKLKSYFPDRELVILNGSFGAWALPQQFNLFVMKASFIDAVIELDGYNEHWNIVGEELFFEAPGPTFIQGTLFSSNLIFHIYTKLFLFFEFKENKFFKNSFLYLLLSNKISNLLLKKLEEIIEKDSASNDFYKRYSYQGESRKEEIPELKIERFKYYITLMNLISKSQRLKFIHFLQPVPAIGKILTDEEKKVTFFNNKYKDKLSKYKASLENIYIKVEKSFSELAKTGFPTYSLLKIFEGTSETVYIDNIHLNERGNELMAEEMVKKITSSWGLIKKEP